jgi:serine/threonine-protein kinase
VRSAEEPAVLGPPPRLRAGLAERGIDVEEELGRGGTSVVYRATDRKHARPVVVKVLRPEVSAALGTIQFLREIQFASVLRHPHLVPLYDSGAVDGSLFYVMPYIDGESLRQRLTRSGRLPMDEALRIAAEVADALAAAHVKGIVHRDIKPENILLEAGHALVADFGVGLAITRAARERASL